MNRVAKVLTLETAWALVDYLNARARAAWEDPPTFEVRLPSRDVVEVWPDSAVRPVEVVELAAWVAIFRKAHFNVEK